MFPSSGVHLMLQLLLVKGWCATAWLRGAVLSVLSFWGLCRKRRPKFNNLPSRWQEQSQEVWRQDFTVRSRAGKTVGSPRKFPRVGRQSQRLFEALRRSRSERGRRQWLDKPGLLCPLPWDHILRIKVLTSRGSLGSKNILLVLGDRVWADFK